MLSVLWISSIPIVSKLIISFQNDSIRREYQSELKISYFSFLAQLFHRYFVECKISKRHRVF